MKMLCRMLATGVVAATLTGCGLWSKEAEIEPNELVSFEAEQQVEVLWSASIGGGFGEKYHQFTPGIDGERIYATDSEGVVVALNRETGAVLWRVELETTLSGGVGAGYDRVVVAAESGQLIALDGNSGEEMWRAELGSEAVSVPQMNTELVVAQLINGQLVAFNGFTGERKWTVDNQVPNLTLRGTSAPVVAADVTIAGMANGNLVAVDNEQGTALWEKTVISPQGRSDLDRVIDIDGRPMIYENTLYVSSYQGRLVAVNPFNAQVLWGKKVSSYRSLAAGFGNIYVSEADDAVQAFDIASSASVWRQAELANRSITSPAVVGTTVAVADYEGYIHFMSQIDGHFVARYAFGSGGVRGDMKVIDDTLYVLGNGGRLAALRLN